MIERKLATQIKDLCGKGKAIIITGARQIGKSTLLNQLFSGQDNVLWLNGDDPDIRSLFDNITSTRLQTLVGTNTMVIIDEAQRISDIGLKLKIMTDNMPGVQIIATGSSSFDLNNKTSESLAGRKRALKMFPVTFSEMVKHTSMIDELRMVPHRMIYGYYPEVVTSPGEEKIILKELSDSYLYKDCLALDTIKKSDKIIKLTKALALQIGDQISYSEIGQMVGLDSKTTEKYIDILEQSYIVFRLGSFAKNMRNELKSSKKIYFWDLGIRNAVIGNFSELSNRNDVGALWENYAIAERLKGKDYLSDFSSQYFWRTKEQQEIDYLEEDGGQIHAFEFKWNEKKANVKIPQSFSKNYADATFDVITPANIETFIG